MIDQTQISKVLEFLNLSQQLFFVLPAGSNPDVFLSVLANYLFFEELIEIKKDKIKLEEVSLFTPKSVKFLKKWPKIEELLLENNLLDLFKTELGKDNLIVNFPYCEEQVDKVSYHIGEESQRFYLTIKPQKGKLPLDSKKVEFNYAGAKADLLMLFGVGDLESLDQLYFGYEDLYKNTALITMNTYLSDFGTLNLDINGSCAYGEAIFYFLKSLATLFELELKDLPRIDLIATLLLSAISLKTDYFASAKMKADSFLAVAELLKFGARRLDLSEKQQLSEKKEKSVVVKKAKSKK